MKRALLPIVLLLLAAGVAPGAPALLGGNLRLGDNLLDASSRHVASGLSSELQQSFGEAWLRRAAECFVAPGNIGNISRPITGADLGVKGNITQLSGTFSVTEGNAVARIGMIEGQVKNPFQIITNLSNTAKAHGATSLRIEGTLANERLYNVLQARYGLQSSGAKDFITIPLTK